MLGIVIRIIQSFLFISVIALGSPLCRGAVKLDPLGAYLDVLGNNEYIGWYDGPIEKADRIVWRSAFDKPLVMSEFGGDARKGLHGPPNMIWTEEYQESLYRHQLAMLERIPFLSGMSPWILKDFRSPRRPLPGIQDYFNRKGLISEKGERKKAFEVLRRFYSSLHAITNEHE